MRARLRLSASLVALAMAAASTPAIAVDEGFIIDVPRGVPASNGAAPAPLASQPEGALPAPVARKEAAPLKVTRLDDAGERPDESALRYYVALNQTNRANVEIQRLARLYQGWVPPVDLFDMDMSSRDEDVLWDLFSADRLTELRLAIDNRRRDDPAWQPSRDLTTKLRRKELRLRIVAFWKDGRWQDLVDYIKNDGYDDDTDVDLLWTVAEAYAKTKQTANAVGVYRSILTASQDPQARLATIQKAMALLRMADVEALIAMSRTKPDGTSEFQPIMVDIVRQRISAFLHDERTAPIPTNELALFQDFARAAEEPDQPGLVAWYYYKTKAYRDALEWFKVALERGGDAMIAHGLAHSLRSLDMRRETEEVAFAWREPLVNNLILFIDILERDLTMENPPFIEPERLARYARVTMDVASGEGAQGLGWYAYNSCQYPVALEWFQRAMAWFPKEATAYGYAMTLKKMKRQKEFVEVVNRWDGLFPQLVDIIFPDGLYHPPTACDIQAAMQLAPAQQATRGAYGQQLTVPGATPGMQGGYGVPQSPMAAYGQPAQAMPMPQYQQPQALKIDPKEFPLAVDPENPLRYVAAISGVRAGAAPPPFYPPAMLHEPWRGPRSLVANRVTGVGAMPYERYGFALLPGWSGQAAASNPTHKLQVAPAGTLWAMEADEKDRPRGAGRPPAGAPSASPNFSSSQNSASSQNLPTSVPLATAEATTPGMRVVGAPVVTPQAQFSQAAPAASYMIVQPPAQTTAAAAPANAAPATGAPAYVETAAYAPSPSRPVLPQTADPAVLALRAQQFFNDKAYADAIDALDQRAALGAAEITDLRMIRGWSLLHLKRAEEARQVFAGLGRSLVAGRSR